MPFARLTALALIALWSIRPVHAQSEGETKATGDVALASLPYAVVQKFIQSKFSVDYAIGTEAVNPFYLTGDFDGDGAMDYVVRLVAKEDKNKEEDVIFFAKGAPRLLSQDIKETYPGPAWYVISKREKISLGAMDEPGAKPPKPKGDSIMMVRPQSSTALVYWNGERFKLFWQGD